MEEKKTGFCAGVLVFSEDLSHIVIVESKKKGNYGFPKGKREQGEVDWMTTALRELHEESSMDKSQISFLCAFDPRRLLAEIHDSGAEMRLAFVEESFRIGSDKNIFCRYAIARALSPSKHVSLQPQDSKEILSVNWLSIEQASDILQHKRSALLMEAIRLIELFHQNFTSCSITNASMS